MSLEQVARQVGLLDPLNEHVWNARPEVDLTFGMDGLDRAWKKWIWVEGARRSVLPPSRASCHSLAPTLRTSC